MGGLSKAAAARALQGLKEKGILEAHRNYDPQRGDLPTTYRLHFQEHGIAADEGSEPARRVSPRETRGVSLERQGSVSLGDTQVTVLQETVRQHTETSNHLEPATLHNATLQPFSKKRFENFKNEGDKAEPQTETEQPRIDLPQPLSPSKNGPASVGDILATRRKTTPRRPKTGSETASTAGAAIRDHRRRGRSPKAPKQIAWLITDFSREFYDEDAVDSNRGQAARLYQASGQSETAFVQLMYEAKAITKDYRIDKPAKGEAGQLGLKNRMPYFSSAERSFGDERAGEYRRPKCGRSNRAGERTRLDTNRRQTIRLPSHGSRLKRGSLLLEHQTDSVPGGSCRSWCRSSSSHG